MDTGRLTFRFDDISANTDESKLKNMCRALKMKFQHVDLIFAISPLCRATKMAG